MFGFSAKWFSFLLASTSTPPSKDVSEYKLSNLIQEIKLHLVDLQTPSIVSKSEISPTLTFSLVKNYSSNEDTYDSGSTNEASRPKEEKPVALYLPGLDGVGFFAYEQFDGLAESFDFWRLSVSKDDRSSYMDVIQSILQFIDSLGPNKEIVLIGESFGGLLACGVALQIKGREESTTASKKASTIKGLVLTNPATSYGETNWDIVGPLLASLNNLNLRNRYGIPDNFPSMYSVVGGLSLALLSPDGYQYQKIIDYMLKLDYLSPAGSNDILESMRDGFQLLEDVLPAETIQHRLERWCTVATPIVNSRLHKLDIPTLLVVGKDDRLLPSSNEAQRLEKILPSVEKLVVDGAGHILLDETFNLTEAIMYSKIDPFHRKSMEDPYDTIHDWTLPSKQRIQEVQQTTVKPLADVVSPVFFSTDGDGKRWMGLSKLPGKDEQLLFVGNHQFGGADLTLIFNQLLEERGIIVRALAHEMVFRGEYHRELQGRTPGIAERKTFSYLNGVVGTFSLYKEFGAVPVNPRNYFRLLTSGQNILLFPDGVREALGKRKDPYELMWPDKVDFVRAAAKHNVTIIPFSAVGFHESVNFVADNDDLERLQKFLPSRSTSGETGGGNFFDVPIPSGRYDESEQFRQAIALPGLPARNYFIFGKPMRTKHIDPKDKESCFDLYNEIREEVKRGLDDLVRTRELDPFKNTPRRVAYERLTGKQAPTIPVEALDRSMDS